MGVVVAAAIVLAVVLAAAPGVGLAAPDQMVPYQDVLFLQPLAAGVVPHTCHGHHPLLVLVVVPAVAQVG